MISEEQVEKILVKLYEKSMVFYGNDECYEPSNDTAKNVFRIAVKAFNKIGFKPLSFDVDHDGTLQIWISKTKNSSQFSCWNSGGYHSIFTDMLKLNEWPYSCEGGNHDGSLPTVDEVIEILRPAIAYALNNNGGTITMNLKDQDRTVFSLMFSNGEFQIIDALPSYRERIEKILNNGIFYPEGSPFEKYNGNSSEGAGFSLKISGLYQDSLGLSCEFEKTW